MEDEKISLIDGVVYLSILGDFAFAAIILYMIFQSDVEHFIMSVILFAIMGAIQGALFFFFCQYKIYEIEKKKKRDY